MQIRVAGRGIEGLVALNWMRGYSAINCFRFTRMPILNGLAEDWVGLVDRIDEGAVAWCTLSPALKGHGCHSRDGCDERKKPDNHKDDHGGFT